MNQDQPQRITDPEDRPARITDPEQVEDAIDLWHDGAGAGLSLAEFLGWSADEYAAYVEESEVPTGGTPELKMLVSTDAVLKVAVLALIRAYRRARIEPNGVGGWRLWTDEEGMDVAADAIENATFVDQN